MSAAFKEWAVICEALGNGRQSVIVRKGGIAEGRDGFSFREKEFLLFPTWFHEQITRTRLPADTEIPPEPSEELEIRYAATVEWAGLVSDMECLRQLESLHVLAEQVVRERFSYDSPEGVHIAFVRIFRLDPPRLLKMDKRYGGCRSWVEVPDPHESAWVSVISDEEHIQRRELLTKVLGI